MRRVRLDDGPQNLERALDVPELAEPHLGAPKFELIDLAFGGEMQAPFQQLVAITPTLRRGIVAVERLVRARIRRLQLQHHLVAGDRVIDVVQHGFVDLGDLRQEVDSFGEIQYPTLPGVEEGPQLIPALAIATQPGEGAKRRGVQRLGVQYLAIDLFRVVAVQLRLVQLGDFDK